MTQGPDPKDQAVDDEAADGREIARGITADDLSGDLYE